jgi:hypothetical protein
LFPPKNHDLRTRFVPDTVEYETLLNVVRYVLPADEEGWARVADMHNSRMDALKPNIARNPVSVKAQFMSLVSINHSALSGETAWGRQLMKLRDAAGAVNNLLNDQDGVRGCDDMFDEHGEEGAEEEDAEEEGEEEEGAEEEEEDEQEVEEEEEDVEAALDAALLRAGGGGAARGKGAQLARAPAPPPRAPAPPPRAPALPPPKPAKAPAIK